MPATGLRSTRPASPRRRRWASSSALAPTNTRGWPWPAWSPATATITWPPRSGPALAAGQIVICDRYLPASLVLQRIDGISWDVILQLNQGADRPALAVILNGSPAVIAARLAARGAHSRFERQPGSTQTESDLYADTAARLAQAGWPVCTIDITTRSADQAAMIVTDRILALHGRREPEPP